MSATVPLLPRAPAALGGALRVKIRGGATLQVPWTIAVPLAEARPDPESRASRAGAFAPSDVEPAVLTVVAGRVDGTAERPQLLPLEELAIDLYRGERRLGPARARPRCAPGALLVRHHRPRAAGGAACRRGSTRCALVAVPVGGGAADEQTSRRRSRVK